MARQRNYRAEYEARVRRAKVEGYRGYGQKRYKQAKAKQQQQTAATTGLMAMFPDAVKFVELTKPQREAINRLQEYGINRTEINNLLSYSGADFWKEARPLLERESELAKGH